MGFGKVGFGEVGFGEVGFGEVGFGEAVFGEVGFGEVGFGEVGGHPNRVFHRHTHEIRSQIFSKKIRERQIEPLRLGCLRLIKRSWVFQSLLETLSIGSWVIVTYCLKYSNSFLDICFLLTFCSEV